ncbi:hypothetical protein DPMN_133611, partial [Dreissena polymorpha]
VNAYAMMAILTLTVTTDNPVVLNVKCQLPLTRDKRSTGITEYEKSAMTVALSVRKTPSLYTTRPVSTAPSKME